MNFNILGIHYKYNYVSNYLLGYNCINDMKIELLFFSRMNFSCGKLDKIKYIVGIQEQHSHD